MSSGLFSLDLFVERISCFVDAPVKTGCAFRLLDFPTVLIPAPTQAPDAAGVVSFQCGKSCMFKSSAAWLNEYLTQAPLVLMCVGMGDGDRLVVVGSACMDLSPLVSKATQSNAGGTLHSVVTLFDMMNNPTAELRLLVRLTYADESLTRHLNITSLVNTATATTTETGSDPMATGSGGVATSIASVAGTAATAQAISGADVTEVPSAGPRGLPPKLPLASRLADLAISSDSMSGAAQIQIASPRRVSSAPSSARGSLHAAIVAHDQFSTAAAMSPRALSPALRQSQPQQQQQQSTMLRVVPSARQSVDAFVPGAELTASTQGLALSAPRGMSQYEYQQFQQHYEHQVQLQQRQRPVVTMEGRESDDGQVYCPPALFYVHDSHADDLQVFLDNTRLQEQQQHMTKQQQYEQQQIQLQQQQQLQADEEELQQRLQRGSRRGVRRSPGRRPRSPVRRSPRRSLTRRSGNGRLFGSPKASGNGTKVFAISPTLRRYPPIMAPTPSSPPLRRSQSRQSRGSRHSSRSRSSGPRKLSPSPRLRAASPRLTAASPRAVGVLRRPATAASGITRGAVANGRAGLAVRSSPRGRVASGRASPSAGVATAAQAYQQRLRQQQQQQREQMQEPPRYAASMMQQQQQTSVPQIPEGFKPLRRSVLDELVDELQYVRSTQYARDMTHSGTTRELSPSMPENRVPMLSGNIRQVLAVKQRAASPRSVGSPRATRVQQLQQQQRQILAQQQSKQKRLLALRPGDIYRKQARTAANLRRQELRLGWTGNVPPGPIWWDQVGKRKKPLWER
eukprot:TRINITY_DN780_c0_g1_i1.p1 TRINITY_DN780_c0_g1~~TRINITY_DN780_c0_g1_i1.p1  ORF type:complete len:795 (+),score=200.25 TRINITY_DN780_c0_g1_i1:81-2465(+)